MEGETTADCVRCRRRGEGQRLGGGLRNEAEEGRGPPASFCPGLPDGAGGADGGRQRADGVPTCRWLCEDGGDGNRF